jgi:tetratricopeptide (TPR) repeat protein
MHGTGLGAPQAFQRAAAFHATGRLREAEQLYDAVLAADPRHFEAIYRLGLIRLHQGRFADAEPLFRRAVKLDKRSADAQHHLAIVLTGMQRLEEAVPRFQRALALRPRYAEAHNNFGHALQLLGRHEDAVAHYEEALAINPAYFEARNNLGNALAALDRIEQSIEQYQKALAINPSYVEAHNNLASALMARKRHNEAVAHCERALALRPHYVEAHINLANALAALGWIEQAVSRYEQALAIAPAQIDVRIRLAHTLLLLDRTKEALAHCDQVLALGPNSHLALHDLGNVLWKLLRPDHALECYDRALAIRADYVPTLINRGNVLIELRRFEQALAGYARVQELEPDNAEAHFAESLLRLRLGDFRLGLEKQEWRGRLKDKASPHRRFHKPLWLGDPDVNGKTILIHAEQGFGDTLQFCRYAELAAQKGARIVLEVQPALKGLFASFAGADTIVAQGEQLPDFDLHCPLLSLPLAFGTTVETIPAKTPYLRAARDLVAKWAERVGRNGKLRVGLAWSGNPSQVNDHNRSMRLQDCLPLFLPGIEVFSLQKEVSPRDLLLLKSRQDLMHFGDELKDFSDTAALISCMDLVISVCTSVGHLAGALNAPTWFVLSDAADWRWLMDRSDCPWYPSARLFRQPQLGDWTTVIREVASELARLRDEQPRTGLAAGTC